jgi:hypothetical protein
LEPQIAISLIFENFTIQAPDNYETVRAMKGEKRQKRLLMAEPPKLKFPTALNKASFLLKN